MAAEEYSTGTLYALVTKNYRIKIVHLVRISLDAKLQTKLDSYFMGLYKNFQFDTNIVEFDPNYTPGDKELFKIKNFKLQEKIKKYLDEPLTCNKLDLKDSSYTIKAILFHKKADDKNITMFQYFDSRKILNRQWTIIRSGDTYSKLDEPGLILDDKLTACLINKNLFFKSFNITRRFLMLDGYFNEATNEDLKDFSTHKMLHIQDFEEFVKNADSVVRKKVALIQANNVLDDVSEEDITETVNEFNKILPSEEKLSIPIKNGRIVLPKEKKEIKAILEFLNDEFATAALTGRKCKANSKRYIS